MAATPTELKIKCERQMQDSFKALDDMRRKGKLCDVTLLVGNVEILAHRNVLASCSPYFYSMFINAVDTTQGRIELDGDPQTFSSVIDYMYTSELTVHEHNLKNLLNIARMLLMVNLQNKCCKLLEQTTNPNNCFDIKTMANTCHNSELLTSTLRYIDVNFLDVVATEGFLNVTNDELVELISRDTLKVSSEEEVYECIVKWIDHDPKGRRKYLRPLMECIRIQFISKAYLKRQIVNGPFLKGDPYCKDLIINALLEADSTSETKPRKYFDRILLVMGGTKEAKGSLEFFNVTTRNWSKVMKTPFDINQACLVTANQNVYVLGGLRNNQAVNSVHLYYITTNSWCEINGMIMERAHFGAAVLDNCIYAVGGKTNSSSVNSAEKFNLNTQEWTSIAPMLTNRRRLGVCVLNDMLYAIGGYGGNDQALKSIECYDYHTNSWKGLCSMNEARSGVGVCALDGKIYAIGGWNGTSYLQMAEVYDPEIDNWTRISQMSVPRAWIGVAIINSQIYIVGTHCVSATHSNSVEIYDKESDSWVMMPEVLNVARCAPAVTVVNKIT